VTLTPNVRLPDITMKMGNPRYGRNRSRGSPNGLRPSTPAEIYDDLLDQALRDPQQHHERPLKKRKSKRDSPEVIVIDDSSQGEMDEAPYGKESNVVVISSSNEDSDEDDMEWDNVDLTNLPMSNEALEAETSPVIREVALPATPQKST
jgi:hypothetical protein